MQQDLVAMVVKQVIQFKKPMQLTLTKWQKMKKKHEFKLMSFN